MIERLVGSPPRQMHERHYLRVADEAMHDAILGLYRDDPICDRQQQTLEPRIVPARKEPARWPAAETAGLELLEQQLRGQGS